MRTFSIQRRLLSADTGHAVNMYESPTHRIRRFIMLLAWIGVGYGVVKYLGQRSEPVTEIDLTNDDGPIRGLPVQEVEAEEAEVVAMAERIETKTADEIEALVAEQKADEVEVIETPPPPAEPTPE